MVDLPITNTNQPQLNDNQIPATPVKDPENQQNHQAHPIGADNPQTQAKPPFGHPVQAPPTAPAGTPPSQPTPLAATDVQPPPPPTTGQPLSPGGVETAPTSPTTPEVKETDESFVALEDLKAPETLKQPQIPQQQPQPPEEIVSLNTVAQKNDVPEVVDKTEQLTQLHHLKDAGDSLTRKADEDEEHFIEEVEKHHGDL